MARIRSVHPGLFTDEAFVSVSAHAQVMFIGILTECDDQGVFEWKPVTIKMRIMPVHNVDCAELLGELEGANMVRGFDHGERKYGAVRNFCRYQRPKKPKAVHPITAEFRTFVALDIVSTEPEPDEAESSPPPKPPDKRRVPKKPEISPQMEEGGGRMERSSEPIGSAPLRSIDPAKRVFDAGKELLARYGVKPNAAGGLITEWRKSIRDDIALLAVITEAGSSDRGDIVAYIAGCVRNRVGGVAAETDDLYRRLGVQ